MSTATTRTLSTTIQAPFSTVVADLADPGNHPRWGTEFFAGPAQPTDTVGEFRVNVPMMGGTARMKTDVVAEHGIIDLYLAPLGAPYGPPVPIRVLRNGDGADVLFTLSRPAGMPDPAWAQAVGSMTRELGNLKYRLEHPAPAGATTQAGG